MNCQIFNRLLPEYLYGEILVEELEPFLAHASACHQCHRLLSEMEETISFVGREANTRFSTEEMAGLRMRVEEVVSGMDRPPIHSSARSRLRFFSRPLFLPAAGALIAASIAAVLLYHPAETPEYVVPSVPNAAEELVAMTETVEEEYDSVDELCREMDELQLLFFEEPSPGSEAEIGSDHLSAPA